MILTPELESRDLIVFRIGQLTMASVDLDSRSRMVHQALQASASEPRRAEREVNRRAARLARELKSLSGFSFVEPGVEALEESRDAYTERNRYVHDLMFHVDERTWSRLDLHTGSRREIDLDHLTATVEKMQRSVWRLTGLFGVLTRYYDPSFAPPADPDYYEYQVRGHFEVVGRNGCSYRAPG